MLDVNKEMTFEEVKNSFSATHEYEVVKLANKLVHVIYTNQDQQEIHKCSDLISKATIQLLIRTIKQLSYNMAVKNYD